MFKKLRVLTIILMISILSTGCGGKNKVENVILPYPATVLNVTIDKKPKTVVSLSPSISDVLIDLGYKDRIVGYSSDFTIPSDVKDPQNIGTGLKPDFEKIGELAPEIIFTNTPLTKVEMEKVSEVGIKVVVMPTVKSIEGLKLRYKELITAMEGQIIGETRSKTVTEEMQGKLDYIVSLLPSKNTTFLYVASLDPIVATGDTYESSLLTLMGNNLAGNFDKYQVTPAQIKLMNPDVIFFSAPLEAEHIKESELFKASKAATSDKLFLVDKTKLALQNRNADDVLREICSKIYK